MCGREKKAHYCPAPPPHFSFTLRSRVSTRNLFLFGFRNRITYITLCRSITYGSRLCVSKLTAMFGVISTRADLQMITWGSILGQEEHIVGRAFLIPQNSPRIRDWRDAHIFAAGFTAEHGDQRLDQITSSSPLSPEGMYSKPAAKRLTLAEAWVKLRAQTIPGDANAEEMLRRIAQLLRC